MMDKEKRHQYRIKRGIKEFDEIFDSMLPYMKDKLVSLDANIRRITKEAEMCSVPKEVVQDRLVERFWSLFREVAKEECERR